MVQYCLFTILDTLFAYVTTKGMDCWWSTKYGSSVLISDFIPYYFGIVDLLQIVRNILIQATLYLLNAQNIHNIYQHWAMIKPRRFLVLYPQLLGLFIDRSKSSWRRA